MNHSQQDFHIRSMQEWDAKYPVSEQSDEAVMDDTTESSDDGSKTNGQKLFDILDKGSIIRVQDNIPMLMIDGLGTMKANDLRDLADEFDRRQG